MSPNQSPAVFVTGLFETHLQVKNLERSREFYSNILGLEVGMTDQERRAVFYWIGGRGKAFLGLWENPPWVAEENTGHKLVPQHLAFEIALADLDRAIRSLKERGIELSNFFGDSTDEPSVFGWIPAASIYFNDPDGHLLEFIAKLPGAAKPEIGVVSLDHWNICITELSQ